MLNVSFSGGRNSSRLAATRDLLAAMLFNIFADGVDFTMFTRQVAIVCAPHTTAAMLASSGVVLRVPDSAKFDDWEHRQLLTAINNIMRQDGDSHIVGSQVPNPSHCSLSSP